MSAPSSALPEIDVATAAERLKQNRAVMVDVREQEEWDDERIAGTTLVPMSAFDPDALPAWSADRPLILQCRSGRRSGLLVNQLLQSGRTDVLNLAGGIVAWRDAGLPIVENE